MLKETFKDYRFFDIIELEVNSCDQPRKIIHYIIYNIESHDDDYMIAEYNVLNYEVKQRWIGRFAFNRIKLVSRAR